MPKKLEELAFAATDRVYGKEDNGPYEGLRFSFGQVVGTMNKLANAMENGEYDFDGTRDKKSVAPVKQRANMVRSQIADIEVMKFKMDAKDDDIKELKKTLRLKQEELSEQQVRVELVEKKLENSSKDGDSRVEKIQRKLDELTMQMKKKEKDFEETMDTLQSDIDTLEQEKLELKDRLKVLSKKTLLEGLTRQSSSSAGGSPGQQAVGSIDLTPVPDSPFLIQQNASLREALRFVKNENIRLKAGKMRSQLANMPTLRIPKKPTGVASATGQVKIGELPDNTPGKTELSQLARKTATLLAEANRLSCCPTVVDITRRKPGCEPVTDRSNPASQLVEQTAALTGMERQLQEVQVQVTTLLASCRTGGQVRTDFSTFPTPQFARMLHEKSRDSVKVGTISVPSKGGKGEVIPINVSPDQMRKIHGKFIS